MELDINKINNNKSINNIIINNNNVNKQYIIPWVEKYRPTKLDNILYNDFIVNSIDQFLKQKKLPNLLFYGPPGTGKTSLITTIAKKYYKNNFNTMTLMINASEERGIETVRIRVKDFSMTRGYYEGEKNLPFKLVILDEIDLMTQDAQSILKKIVQKYINVRFCFICNINNKIDPGIISCCTVFKFKPFPHTCLQEFVDNICSKENFKVSQDSRNLIIDKSNGDLRKMLNILQSIKMYISNKNLQSEIVQENITSEILCSPLKNTVIDILNFIQQNSLKKSIEYFTHIIKQDIIPLSEFIESVFNILKQRIINDDKTIIKYSIKKISNIIIRLNEVNNNLNKCDNEIFQIPTFIASFYLD